MITRKVWLAVVAVLGLGTAVLLSTTYSFVPKVQDVADPLGRPSALAVSAIHSSSEFDRITALLVPQHVDLSKRIQVLNTVANNLDTLVGNAGKLGPTAVSVNSGTMAVRAIAKPLPALIDKVTARVEEATPGVAALSTAVGSVTTQLQGVGGQLDSIQTNLAALGPLASSIDETLGQIQAESEHIKFAGPLLPLLAQLLNGAPVNTAPVLSLLTGLLNGH